MNVLILTVHCFNASLPAPASVHIITPYSLNF